MAIEPFSGQGLEIRIFKVDLLLLSLFRISECRSNIFSKPRRFSDSSRPLMSIIQHSIGDRLILMTSVFILNAHT